MALTKKGSKIMENTNFKSNGEWLLFISDLEDLACYLRSEKVEMYENADLVSKAIELLIAWNPERRESIKRCSK